MYFGALVTVTTWVHKSIIIFKVINGIVLKWIMYSNEVVKCAECSRYPCLHVKVVLRGKEKNVEAAFENTKYSFNDIASRCMAKIE